MRPAGFFSFQLSARGFQEIGKNDLQRYYAIVQVHKCVIAIHLAYPYAMLCPPPPDPPPPGLIVVYKCTSLCV